MTVNESDLTHESMITKLIAHHFGYTPKHITRIAIGICNEVYAVGLKNSDVIVRMSQQDKYLLGSRDHIPQFKSLGIRVPDILFEDYSKTLIPLSYQVQSKIEGQDLGVCIEHLSTLQLQDLAAQIVNIFNKVKTIPADDKFGLIWGGGDNDVSDSWAERMKIWVNESKERGLATGVMDDAMLHVAESIYTDYEEYFKSVKPVTYYGDICSKNVMIHDGVFNGLVDLDGLTQGDPLEAIGRIKLSWYGTRYGEFYANCVMDNLMLDQDKKKLVTIYALINQISWACENGIQFNQNTKVIVDIDKRNKDRRVVEILHNDV